MGTFKYSQYTNKSIFQRLGFDENPFEFTNADEEDRLHDYFVPPPYFVSVFGDPNHPKSFFVFAPRGGGKTAQRRMIEEQCEKEDVLAITYDRFDFLGKKKIKEITSNDHLQKINERCLAGLLVALYGNPDAKNALSKYEREMLVILSSKYLSGLDEVAMKGTLDSLKSFKNRVQDFWNEWFPLIGPGINILIKKLAGVDVGQFSDYHKDSRFKTTPPKHELKIIVDLAQKIGYRSIYVLIDRVDETEITGNDAKASFMLIEPLVRDLELLELKGIAFKFFLWDQLEPLYLSIARTDRIRHEILEWDDEMLLEMWSKRLAAYSSGMVKGLNDVSEPLENYSVDELAVIFANQSPRDMIRIGAQIIAEQQEIKLFTRKISDQAIFRGIEKFSFRRSGEILSNKTLQDLRKIPQVDFTIPYLANDVFKEKQTNTRNRISRWRKEGAIVEVERIENPSPHRVRPVKLFAISDIRVAKSMFADMSLPVFLNKKYKKCPKCGNTVLRDWGERDSSSRCDSCQFDLLSEDSDDREWKWREAAKQTKRNRRTELLEQLELEFDTDFESD